MAIWLIIVMLALAGLFVLLESGMAVFATLPAMPIAVAVIAVLIAIYFATTRGQGEGRKVSRRAAAIAAGLALVAAAAGYSLIGQGALKGLATGLLKPADAVYDETKDGPRAVRLRVRDNGQFVARAEVNGAGLDLLVDTGAASVILKHADAEAAGIDTSRLSFTTPIKTANGTAYTAPVRIRAITVGPIRIDGVEALVAKPGSVNESLLGMSFLRRLRSYDLAGEFLTLRQ